MMMNEEKILNLVEKGESETLEFKRNFNKDAIETIKEDISKEQKIPITRWTLAR